MKRLTSLVCLSLALVASLAFAADSSRNNSDLVPADGRGANNNELYGVSVSANKAAADTVYVLGGPAQLSGKFQDSTGTLPDQQGWIGNDVTHKTSFKWNIDDFNCANLDPLTVPNHAMWCGETFAAGCGGGDPAEGYANGYEEWLDWTGVVADNSLPTQVTVNAMFNNNSENDYDFLWLEVDRAGVMDQIGPSYSGQHIGVAFTQTFTVASTDYVGTGLDEVHLRWRATADTGYSDSDCLFPSIGHSQIDLIEVLFGGVRQTLDTFETGDPQSWFPFLPPWVGDFSKVWPRLADTDACTGNNSPQYAFIDDGIVVPGTNGSRGLSWTYGPGGFVVNTTGGLAGPEYGLDNEIWSPALDWPAGAYDGGNFIWNVYTHLPLDNGIFYNWQIRNSTDGGLTWGAWRSNNFVYYGGGLATYGRPGFVMNTYLTPGRNKVQIALGATEPWPADYVSNDGTPAPYFDNVTLVAFTIGGPGITTRDIDLFNDGWPSASEIDYVNLGNNSVRVDMARNISNPLHSRNDPGDSIVCTVKAVRTGSVLNDRPEMHVLMKANPLFDTFRTLPAGFTQTGNMISGTVLGDTIRAGTPPVVVVNVWKWDLPDTGFFFPGDMFHYYFKAQDNLAGDIGTTYLPGDTTGFSFFPGHPDYRSNTMYEAYKIDALPTMHSATAGDQPTLLFWDDSQDRANQNEWFMALDNLGYRQGIDFDIYCNNGPSSGVGNGLGGRTNELKMAGYSTMMYTSGNLGTFTFSNGDYAQDPGNDIAVVDAWLSLGGKNMFATGDNIIQNLSNSGVNGVAFRDKWFSVTFDDPNLGSLIAQVAPRVAPITVAGAPVLSRPYIAFGGCDGGINDFDAVTAVAPAVRIGAFTTAAGATINPYAAAIYNNVVANTARVVFMPYDLMYIYNIGTNPGTRPVRADILQDILAFFGQLPGGTAVGVTPDAVFTARNFPNPFNPSTKIEFTLPRAGQVELKIYNVRGELVKTLLDQNMDAATHSVVWDGRNTTGQSVSSGVYFYSLKAGSYEKMEKMTLVK